MTPVLHALPESRRRPRRSTGGLATSVVLHAALIGAVAVGTVRATPAPAPDAAERVIYVPPPAPVAVAPSMPDAPRAPEAPAAPATPPTLPVAPPLVAPIDVPGLLPPPGPVALPDDFVARRAVGTAPATPTGGAVGTGGSGGLPPSDGVWSAHVVEREVLALPGAAPRYPETLRTAGVEGALVVEFVVDTTGRVEPASVTVVQGAHPLFEHAVRDALRRMRFRPAEAGGRRVRQLVRQPFTFALR